MSNINKDKTVRRILITDIAGVLNDSRDRYRMHQFDADKVRQLMRIVKETGCDIMLAPSLPDSPKMLSEIDRRTFGCVVAGNLLSSILGVRVMSPSWLWYANSPIDAAFDTVSQWMAEKDHETTYCILRAHDDGECRWACTFGTRLVRARTQIEVSQLVGGGRIVSDVVDECIGLTESIANDVIAKLKTPVLPEEIPVMGVVGIKDAKAALEKIRIHPTELKDISGCGRTKQGK